jgi:hypothetical protein
MSFSRSKTTLQGLKRNHTSNITLSITASKGTLVAEYTVFGFVGQSLSLVGVLAPYFKRPFGCMEYSLAVKKASRVIL